VLFNLLKILRDAVAASFSMAMAFITAPSSQTPTLLCNGKLLVTGGATNKLRPQRSYPIRP